MKTGSPSLSACLHCLWAGSSLMCLALMLHPMSPEDFLAAALMAPQTTWQDMNGIQATILFWLGAVATTAGLGGILHRVTLFVRRTIDATRSVGAMSVRTSWSS